MIQVNTDALGTLHFHVEREVSKSGTVVTFCGRGPNLMAVSRGGWPDGTISNPVAI